jgi:hypothetical protein
VTSSGTRPALRRPCDGRQRAHDVFAGGKAINAIHPTVVRIEPLRHHHATAGGHIRRRDGQDLGVRQWFTVGEPDRASNPAAPRQHDREVAHLLPFSNHQRRSDTAGSPGAVAACQVAALARGQRITSCRNTLQRKTSVGACDDAESVNRVK